MPVVSGDLFDSEFDVCVVGAGPAGLSCAFACHDRGLRVLVLEAGHKRPIPGTPDVIAAEIKYPDAHDPVSIIAASALGGSSHWWGGRSLPMDPVDLLNWPISGSDLIPYWRYAAELIGAGSVIERPAPGNFSELKQFDATTFETWAPRPVLPHHWRRRIEARDGPAIVLSARVTGLRRAGAVISAVDVVTPAGRRSVRARRYVLTGGGLGCLRLMLMAQRADPALFGGPDGPLGKGYMGHLTGSVSDIVFSERKDAAAFNFLQSGGSYIKRRRLRARESTVIDQAICNIAFWIDNPARGVATHRSAAASARFLAASGVRLLAGHYGLEELPALGPHFSNVGRSPLAALSGVAQAGVMLLAARISRRRLLPRGFLSSGDNGWRLVYHAEQKADPANRVSLCETLDSLGLPKLHIDFRFSAENASSVMRAHELLDADLRASGAGELRWTAKDPHQSVLEAAHDGYHQLGGSIMSNNRDLGVVDPQCRVHDLANLFVVGGCVFPSGGQANPTLTIIALACRLADHLASFPRERVCASDTVQL